MLRNTPAPDLQLAAEAMAFELQARFGLPVTIAVRAAKHMLLGVAFAEAWQQARYEEDALVAELAQGSTERARAAKSEMASRIYHKLNPAGAPAASEPMSHAQGAALLASLQAN